MRHYKLIACGGTFDLLHNGHKAFLQHAFSLAERVLIGITSDTFTIKQKAHGAPFAERKKALVRFLQEQYLSDQAEIVAIDDIYGPTLDRTVPIEALVVAKDAIRGAKAINDRRQERSMQPLPIHEAPLILAEDGKLIATTRIRNGEISPEGKLYIKKEWRTKTLQITDELREILKKPFGEMIHDLAQWLQTHSIDLDTTLLVGDIVTKSFHEQKYAPVISYIDFYSQRKRMFTSLQDLGFDGSESVHPIVNPAGTITESLWEVTKTVLTRKRHEKKRSVVVIDGEEDLSVLPAIATAPLGYVIFYGQPQSGVVRITVDLAQKEHAWRLLSAFLQQ